MAFNINVPDQHQITQAARRLKFQLISAIFFYHGTPGLLFHLPFPLLWHNIIFSKTATSLNFCTWKRIQNTQKVSALSQVQIQQSRVLSNAREGWTFTKKKKKDWTTFSSDKREQRMFHAAWEAGFSSAATKKMAIEK